MINMRHDAIIKSMLKKIEQLIEPDPRFLRISSYICHPKISDLVR